jgi:hypothetical protein
MLILLFTKVTSYFILCFLIFELGSSISNAEKISILKGAGLFKEKAPRKKAKAKKIVEPMSAAVADITEPSILKKRVATVATAQITSKRQKAKHSTMATAQITKRQKAKHSSSEEESDIDIGSKCYGDHNDYIVERQMIQRTGVKFERKKPEVSQSLSQRDEEYDWLDIEDNDGYWDKLELDLPSYSSNSTSSAAAKAPLIVFDIGEKVRNRHSVFGVITAKHLDGTYDIKCKYCLSFSY